MLGFDKHLVLEFNLFAKTVKTMETVRLTMNRLYPTTKVAAKTWLNYWEKV